MKRRILLCGTNSGRFLLFAVQSFRLPKGSIPDKTKFHHRQKASTEVVYATITPRPTAEMETKDVPNLKLAGARGKTHNYQMLSGRKTKKTFPSAENKFLKLH